MSDIYAQHRAIFNQISAYVVMYGGERVATVAIKYPRDGAGRLYSYVHWLGLPMVRGYAGGYGYDKRTAACASAAHKLPESLPEGYADRWDEYAAFLATMREDGGLDWNSALTRAGFTVLQAV